MVNASFKNFLDIINIIFLQFNIKIQNFFGKKIYLFQKNFYGFKL